MANRIMTVCFLFSLLFSCVPTITTAGVRQVRTTENSNMGMGTNAYKDMEEAYVNPAFEDGANAYHAGDVQGEPQVAVPEQAGMADYNGYGAVVASGYYYDYNAWAASVTPGSVLPIGTILEYVPPRAVPLMVQGTRYYYADNTFVVEVFDGYGVVYQVVPAPVGAVVSQLPAGCMVQNFNGKSLTQCGTTYFRQVAGGYEIVAAN